MGFMNRPEWVNKRRIVRLLQAALGALAGALGAVGSVLGGLWFDELPLWERLALAAGGIIFFAALAGYIVRLAYQ